MHRRTAAQRQDGSKWNYGYNDRGEVTSAAKEDATNIPEPGKQFGFSFDGLGNRTSSTVSSLNDDQTVRTTGYTANALNQYDEITHPSPGWLVLRGSANTQATVTIDNEPPTVRAGPLWHYETSVNNSSGPVRRVAEITATRATVGLNNGPVTTKRKGSMFIPPPSESPTYDLDGNQTSDARWNYAWDGENRMIVAEEKVIATQPSNSPTKRLKLEFTYDAQGRRLTKRVLAAEGSGSFVLQQSLVFLYDGWNMIAELSSSSASVPLALLRSYEWGLDVSGTMDGAGGVGGLLVLRYHPSTINSQPSTGAHAPLYDGNGNITELINLASNTVSARYEYGAFGETISVDGGAVAEANPFRFSTKYLDAETELVDYGMRIYIPLLGRWLNRDPIEEAGGVNLYGMCGNDPTNRWDRLGEEWFLQLDGVDGDMFGQSGKADAQAWSDKIGKNGTGHGQATRLYAAVTAVEKSVNEIKWNPGFTGKSAPLHFNSASPLAKAGKCYKELYLFLVTWNERGYKYGQPPSGAFQASNNTYLKQIVKVSISTDGVVQANVEPGFNTWAIASEPIPTSGSDLGKINGGGAIGSQLKTSASFDSPGSWKAVYDGGGGWSSNGTVYWTGTGLVSGGAELTQNIITYPNAKRPNKIDDTQANNDKIDSRPMLQIKLKKINK